MAAPKVKFKRSSVALKAPGLANLELGEVALNTYDGKLFTRKDTGGVGIATTVTVLNPWDENYGGESITYAGIQTSGGGITTDFSTVTLSGLTPTGFNTTYTRQSNGFVLDTGTLASGNAQFDTDSNYYYYVDSDNTNRMLIFSESDNSWMGVATSESAATTEYNVLTTSGLSPSSFNQTYARQATGFVLDTGTISSGNALFKADSNYYYYVATTGSDAEDRIVIYSEEDGGWMTLYDFNDPDFREGNISDNQAVGSSMIFSAALATASDTFNGRNVPDADDANVTYATTQDYSSLTLDAGISDFDGDYTRQSFKAKLDTGTVSSGNALFAADSSYWWFLKNGDNSKMVIYDSVAGYWTYVGKTGGDFSSAADNTAVGSVNSVESQTISSVAYESDAYQPDANYSEITYGSLSGTDFTSASNNDKVQTTVLANEQIVLSGMSDSNHNDTYNMVYRSGTRLLATAEQSGADIKISIQREAEYFLGVSGTGISAIDNGGNLTVIKHTGYLTNSGNTWTWSTGSVGSEFHYYYWDTTDDILVAWDGTNSEWKAFDLGEATGNVASFISDLDSGGSTPGYVSGGENFTLTSGNIASLTSNKDTYPGTLIFKVPDGDDSNITYASASDHPYYVYQNEAANKWILFTTEASYYWTAWHRSAAFDLSTETLTDDATAFTLDDSSDFEFVTTNSDTYNGNNIPDADDSNVTYSAASTSGITTVTVTSGKTTADSRSVPTASGNIVYGTTTQSVSTSRVGVVTITKYGDLEIAGIVTATDGFTGDLTGDVTGNVTGNLTGTVLTASQTNITSVGTLGSLAVTNNITVGGTVDGRDVLDDGQAGDNLVTLSGVSRDSTHLGTFTGTTISDNGTIKAAIQELETAVDNVVAGNSGAASVLTQSVSTDASFFPTFVPDNNGSATQESIKTDAGITYNPSTNILTVSGSVAANVTGNITGNVTGNADTATEATNFTVTANNTTNETVYPVFVDGATGTQGAETDTGLSYNPSTGNLTATTFTGNVTGNVTGDLTGTADMADNVGVTNISTTNVDFTLVMSDGSNTSTGRALGMDSSLTYNPNTNVLTAETVSGNLTGNVTGNVNGDVTGDLTGNVVGVVTATTLKVGNSATMVGITTVLDEDDMSSNSATALVTQQSIKAYVDSQVTAQDLDFTADTGGTRSIDLDSETFRILGTTNEIETSGSSNTVTIGLPDNVSVFNNLTVGGNITIGGTLTYEDVANVDSVGLITARSGVIVNGAGIGLSVTEGGARITGVTTSSGGFVGNLTGNVTGNVTGNLDGIVGGNTPAAVTGTTITANTGFVGDLTGDVTGDVTGTATTATNAVQLQTARNIGGVSFNGTADINLPGVNATGNQDTTGNAATATSLATARTIHGVSFDGTSNIDLSEVIQDTVGGMFGSNTETGITVTYEDSDGTIDLVVGTLNQDTTGTAALAEGLTGTPNITVGVVTASSLDISGNVDVDGTLEADAITIDGVSLAETISDTVGAMVTSNTETGISVTYDDSDNTLDFVIGTLNQDTTGNAATATALETARTIGGVSFDGSANINLPGVNASGNQDTSGNAATATALETARNIGGVSFNGTADINLPGVNAAGNQNTSGTAAGLSGSPSITVTDITATGNVSIAGTLTYEDVTSIDSVGLITARTGVRVTSGGLTVSGGGANITGGITGDLTGDVTGNADTATRLATARTLGGVSFDGTGNINLPGVNATGNQDTSGNAATATALATARTIAGVSFDGTSNISLNNNAITNGAGYITTSFVNTNQLVNGAGFITNSVTGDFSVSGNISIGGTLTYEDVTNVDSIGVVTARSGIKVPDGQKINLGTGDDLQIYHGGNHSYIDDAGTGNLRLRSGTIELTNLAGSKKSAEFNSGGGQELYHNNTKKFETTGNGVTISGGLVAGGLTYPTSDGTANQVLVTDGSGNLSFADQSLPTGVTTTTTTNETSIDTFSSSTYSTGIYHIQATRGGDVELTQFKVIHNGTTTFITEFGTVSTGPGIATYSADINSGNVRLLAYPSSSDSTVFKKDRTLIETGTSPAGSTTTTSTSTTNIDTVSTTNKAVVYEIECSRGTAVHLTTINLVHDGTSVYLSEFGTVKSGNSLATFDADISGSTIRLRATPTTADSTTFNVNRTVMT